jgi:fructose-1,6-bisphosphatase/inositol monophosphatase family enzyme
MSDLEISARNRHGCRELSRHRVDAALRRRSPRNARQVGQSGGVFRTISFPMPTWPQRGSWANASGKRFQPTHCSAKKHSDAMSMSTSAEHLWIIDPLDGTNNFAHRLPHFAVSIAYYHRGVAQVGVIHNPATGQWFTAVRGQGAFAGGKRASVSLHTSLSKVIVGCGFYYDRGEMMRRTLSHRSKSSFRSISTAFGASEPRRLDLCMVGCGQFGGYFEYQLSPWDFAAGTIVRRRSRRQGHVCSRWQNLPVGRSSILASNGALHETMLAVTTKASSLGKQIDAPVQLGIKPFFVVLVLEPACFEYEYHFIEYEYEYEKRNRDTKMRLRRSDFGSPILFVANMTWAHFFVRETSFHE